MQLLERIDCAHQIGALASEVQLRERRLEVGLQLLDLRDRRRIPRARLGELKAQLRLPRGEAARKRGDRGAAKFFVVLCRPSLQRAPSNPPALGRGFDAWGHSRETRELAGAVGEGATPCTDGRPPENTPAWIASHQSSLPNAAKGYPPREPRESSPVQH